MAQEMSKYAAAGVNIDADTMAVTLVDRHGDTIYKKDLSAGEKQIYAISMLWALGLRISELTGLSVGSFESDIDSKNKIGLLLKVQSQQALNKHTIVLVLLHYYL